MNLEKQLCVGQKTGAQGNTGLENAGHIERKFMEMGRQANRDPNQTEGEPVPSHLFKDWGRRISVSSRPVWAIEVRAVPAWTTVTLPVPNRTNQTCEKVKSSLGIWGPAIRKDCF